MSVDATLGLGTRLYYSTNSGSSYTELTDLMEIGDPPNTTVEKIDVTSVNPTSRRREKKAGLSDGGNFDFAQFWNKTRYTTLKAFYDAGTSLRWKLVYPDNTDPAQASNLVFDGPLEKCQSSGTANNKPLCIKCSVFVSGSDAFTPGS